MKNPHRILTLGLLLLAPLSFCLGRASRGPEVTVSQPDQAPAQSAPAPARDLQSREAAAGKTPAPEPERAEVAAAEPARRSLPASGLMPVADPEARASLRGLLVDAEGHPLRSTSLRAWLRFGEGREAHSYQHIDTDAEGRFSLSLRGALPGKAAGSLHLEEGVPSRRMRAYVPPRYFALCDLPHPLPQGETELGRLQLQSRPLVAGGQIRDLGGKPVAGAMLDFSIGLSGAFPRALTLRSDAEGRFAVYMDGQARSARVRVEQPGYRHGKPFTLRVGADDHVLVLEQAGELRVKFICKTPGRPTVELQAQDGSRHKPKASFHNKSNTEHSYVFRALPLGQAQLSYRKGAAPARQASLSVTRASGGARPQPLRFEIE